MTLLFAKGNMDIESGHNSYFLRIILNVVPLSMMDDFTKILPEW